MVTSSAHSRSDPAGMPVAIRVTFTPSVLEKSREIDRGGLAFHGGRGRENHLRGQTLAHPIEKTLNSKLIRPYPLDRRKGAMKNVITAPVTPAAVDGHYVSGFFDNTDESVDARRIRADQAHRPIRERVTSLAQADALGKGLDGQGQAAVVLDARLEQKEGHALRRFGTEAGEPAQLGDQSGDGFWIVHLGFVKPEV